MRNATSGPGGSYGFGLTGEVPRDVWLLLGIVFATFSLRFFSASAGLPAALELTPLVWQKAFLWQLVTYPFVGGGPQGIWFVIELVILFLFARTVYYQLGRRKFWQMLVALALAASLAAVLVDVVGTFIAGARPWQLPFTLMQGQRMLVVMLVALFAVLNRRATILLFFVLPIQAGWFLGLEIVFGFLGFLGTKDLPGFVGICVAVGGAVALLDRGRSGGFGGGLREAWLRLQAAWFRFRLARAKHKRGLRVVGGGSNERDDDHWVH